MNCERCGVETGDYRMHPDPHVCVGVLEGVAEGLRAEVARLTAELGESVKLWLAEREAHAKTRKDLDFARSDQERTRDNFILHQFRADRAEAVLRGLRSELESLERAGNGVCSADALVVGHAARDVLAKLDELEREQGVSL